MVPRMKVEPLKLKTLVEGMGAEAIPTASAAARIFIPSGRPPAAETPPPPVFSEADMRSAEREGFQKGFIEGIEEGRRQAESAQAEINRQVAAMAGRFVEAIGPLFSHYREFSAMLYREMPRVALAIARKAAGPALEQNAHLRVGDIAARACETMINEARLTITAHESLGDTLENMLLALASRLPEHTEIVILRDPAMPLADCRIEWECGSMRHSVDELWQRIEKAVENLSAASLRDGAAELRRLEQQVLPENTRDPTDNETKE